MDRMKLIVDTRGIYLQDYSLSPIKINNQFTKCNSHFIDLFLTESFAKTIKLIAKSLNRFLADSVTAVHLIG